MARAPALHAGGQEFDSPSLHHYLSNQLMIIVAYFFMYFFPAIISAGFAWMAISAVQRIILHKSTFRPQIFSIALIYTMLYLIAVYSFEESYRLYMFPVMFLGGLVSYSLIIRKRYMEIALWQFFNTFLIGFTFIIITLAVASSV